MDTDNPSAGSAWVVVLLALALIVMSVSELLNIYLHQGSGSAVSRLAFLVLCPALVPFFTLREWMLALMAGLLTLGLALKPDGWDAILYALDRGAFLAAFIYLVTLLKEAAQRSNSVLELGVFLTRQPPGRRYYSLAVGGHAMGVLLNFGAISLLTPLIQRGARASAEAAGQGQADARLLERNQISALLRGFSWMIMWAPTALTQAVLFTAFPGTNAAIVIPLGIGASIVMILIGRAMSRPARRGAGAVSPAEPPLFPKRSGIRFALVCGLLIVATVTVVLSAGVSAAVALMLVAPVVMIAWIFEQNAAAQLATAVQATLRSLHGIFVRSAIVSARSAFMLGAAGFIGEAAAKLAPVAEVAAFLSIETVPVGVFLMALPILITLGGQIALSPILVVVFLSAVLNELPVLPADPNLIVFALGAKLSC